MNEELNINDALGNLIMIGYPYGYSTDSNGLTKVTIGIAKKFTPTGMVSLTPLYCMDGMWKEKPSKTLIPKSVTVKPMKLFPVILGDLNTT